MGRDQIGDRVAELSIVREHLEVRVAFVRGVVGSLVRSGGGSAHLVHRRLWRGKRFGPVSLSLDIARETDKQRGNGNAPWIESVRGNHDFTLLLWLDQQSLYHS